MAEKREGSEVTPEVALTPGTRRAPALPRLRIRREYGLVSALLFVMVLYTVLAPGFLTTFNLINVLRQVSIVEIAAVGGTMVILLGGIDLSTGSIVNLSGCAAALFLLNNGGIYGQSYGLPIALIAIALAVAVGAGVGFVNGVTITVGRIPPFIATLATMTAFQGLAELLTNANPVLIQTGPYTAVALGDLFGIPYAIYIMALITIGGWILLTRTKLGRQIYAFGGNSVAATLSGVRGNRTQLFVYVLAGALAGVSGVIVSALVTSGQPEGAVGFNLDVIAAVVVGGTSLMGGRGTLMGTVLGAVFIAVLGNGLTLLNVQTYWQEILNGVVIAGAVGLDGFVARRTR